MLREEAETTLKSQKKNIQGDTDNTLPEEELESSKKVKNSAFKEDKPDLTAKPEIVENSKKKDQKSRFLTNYGLGNVNSDAETKNLEQKQDKVKAINNHPFRHLIFSPFVTESILKKHLSITYRGLVYSVKCLKGPTDKFIKTKQVSLIDPKGEKSL